MKSIKEKSFELFPEMQTESDDWDVIEEQCDRDEQRKAFVKGAKYVLDEIESLMKDVSDEYPLFQQGAIIHVRLFKLLEQLKK